MPQSETSRNPFDNFKPETAEKIIDLVEDLCIDDIDASAHLAGVLVSLVPEVKHAVMLVEFADHVAREFEKSSDSRKSQLNALNSPFRLYDRLPPTRF